jgi:membrane protein DedA with SNARE-associated domain
MIFGISSMKFSSFLYFNFFSVLARVSQETLSELKGKGKFTLEQTTIAQMVNRGIALLFL